MYMYNKKRKRKQVYSNFLLPRVIVIKGVKTFPRETASMVTPLLPNDLKSATHILSMQAYEDNF